MISRNLIETARALIPAGPGRPRQTDLRRAASTHLLRGVSPPHAVLRRPAGWNRSRPANPGLEPCVPSVEPRSVRAGVQVPRNKSSLTRGSQTDGSASGSQGPAPRSGLRPRGTIHEVGGPERRWRDRVRIGRVRQVISQRSARAGRAAAVPRAARLIARRLPFPITAGPRECPAFGHLAAGRLRRILFRLQEATDPRSADAPGFRLHPPKDDRAGRWSVRVSGNWRVVFRFEDKEVVDVNLMDYHCR